MSFLLENVGFSYNTGGKTGLPERVLTEVNQSFPSGARTALLGPSGAGKTTLICLLGLLTGTRRFEGEIHYTDADGRTHFWQKLTAAESDGLRRTEFGFALQSSYLLPHLTVLQNLAIPLGLQGHPEPYRTERARVMLASADPRLLELGGHLPSQLSGGQQQRVAVLRALIHDPVVVFADEPFSALDEDNKEIILNILKTWQEGEFRTDRPSGTRRSLFLVCHDPQVPVKYQADILHMDLKTPPRLTQATPRP